MGKKEPEHLIYGINPVREALHAGKTFDRILLRSGDQRSSSLNEIVKLARAREVPVQFVPRVKLNKITGKNHQGIIGFISPVSFSSPNELITSLYEEGRSPALFLLEGITDVRNFGAICRSALECGIDGMILPKSGIARLGGDAIKSSAGALLELPMARSDDLGEVVTLLKNSGLQVLAGTEKGEGPLHQQDLTLPTAFLLGAEGSGITNNLLEKATKTIRIPGTGRIGSLNVSVAAGVIGYESFKQRHFSSAPNRFY